MTKKEFCEILDDLKWKKIKGEAQSYYKLKFDICFSSEENTKTTSSVFIFLSGFDFLQINLKTMEAYKCGNNDFQKQIQSLDQPNYMLFLQLINRLRIDVGLHLV